VPGSRVRDATHPTSPEGIVGFFSVLAGEIRGVSLWLVVCQRRVLLNKQKVLPCRESPLPKLSVVGMISGICVCGVAIAEDVRCGAVATAFRDFM
jgi:hypothetical protein